LALEQWASAELCGVQHRAPHIFGRAAITLGIGPHSVVGLCMLCGRQCAAKKIRGHGVLPSRYVLVQLKQSWEDAKRYCAAHYNNDLAIVTNQTEEDALVGSIPGQLL